MSERREDEAARLDPASGAGASVATTGAASAPVACALDESAARVARRLQAASSLLLNRPPLLLPVAAQLRDERPVFESAIRGSSMSPAIPRHARLQVQLLGEQDCQRGDVVFFLADDGYVVHRVVHRGGGPGGADYLLTLGDNRLAPDPPVPSNQVLGTVIAVQTARGWRPPGPPPTGSFHRRVLRAITVAAVVAALGCSASAARRLGATLLRLESLGRAAVQRCRRLLHRQGRPR